MERFVAILGLSLVLLQGVPGVCHTAAKMACCRASVDQAGGAISCCKPGGQKAANLPVNQSSLEEGSFFSTGGFVRSALASNPFHFLSGVEVAASFSHSPPLFILNSSFLI